MTRLLLWEPVDYIEQVLCRSAVFLPGGCLLWPGPINNTVPRLIIGKKSLQVRRIWYEFETGKKLAPGQQIRQNADCLRQHGSRCIASEHQHVTDGLNDNREASRRYTEQRQHCRVCGCRLHRTKSLERRYWSVHKRRTKSLTVYRRERKRLQRLTEGFKLGFCPKHLQQFEDRLVRGCQINDATNLTKKWVRLKGRKHGKEG